MVQIRDIIDTQKFTAEQILLEVEKLDPLLYLFDRNTACEKVSILTDHYVLIYSEKINKNSNLKLPHSFYSDFLTSYLGYVISVLYAKFLKYEKILEKNNRVSIYFFSDHAPQRIFNSSEDFFDNLYSNISFQNWMDSTLVKHLFPRNLIDHVMQKDIELNTPRNINIKGLKNNIIDYINRKICFCNISKICFFIFFKCYKKNIYIIW